MNPLENFLADHPLIEMVVSFIVVGAVIALVVTLIVCLEPLP